MVIKAAQGCLCHLYYVFLLQAFKDNNVITLEKVYDLLKYMSEESKNSPIFLLPSDHDAVIQLCNDLNDRGHTMFIEHPSDSKKSWLVLEQLPLLEEFLGSLFAPRNFPQHCPISYSTGVVPLSSFKKHFCERQRQNHTATMLLTFLSRMECCREITDSTVLESIVKQEGYSQTEKYYFLSKFNQP